MEYRKIIKFGNSSHVVSLPNSWMKKNNLSKGDTVFFEENGSNELVFFSKFSENRENLKEITIDATDKSVEAINREVVAAYINNYNTIKIVDKNLDKRSNEVRNIIHGLSGIEIVEQTNNSLITKDFLNTKEISFPGIVRRTDIILRNMLNNTKNCFKTDYCISISNSDFDINRLCFVVGKITRNAMDNPQITKEMQLSMHEIMNYWLLMSTLESFADECKRVARLFRTLKLKKDELTEIKKLFDQIESNYIDAITSFYNKDRKMAYEVLERRNDLISQTQSFMNKNKDLVNVRMIEKLKNMIGNEKRIARLAINLSM